MANSLEKYRDYEIEVHYLTDNNIYKDRGRLVDFGEGWIELDKSGAETLLIPTTAIRIAKVLQPPPEVEGLLLRPAARPDDESEPIERRR